MHRLAERSWRFRRRRRRKGTCANFSRYLLECDHIVSRYAIHVHIPARNTSFIFPRAYFSPYIYAYAPVSNANLDFAPSPSPPERICRLSSRCYCVTRGTTAFEMPPHPCYAESWANVIIFRNLLSRCSHCARLCRGRSLFSFHPCSLPPPLSFLLP